MVLVLFALAPLDAPAQRPCPPWPAVNGDGIGPFDYTDPAQASWLRNVNGNHFNHNVRALVKGQTNAFVALDLDYVLRRFPNHHPALDAMMRLANKEQTQKPTGAPANVECYLYRATVFAPNDPVSKTLYGIQLLKLRKHKEALVQLTAAHELRPDDRNVHYNLALLYFDEKNYDKAKEHAKRAYELGFPLPGLKKKLQSVNAWDD
jgi:tetratricopeptide (TPR) repeat protein